MSTQLRGSRESTHLGDMGLPRLLLSIEESLTLKELQDAYVCHINDVVAAKGHGIYSLNAQNEPQLVQARGVSDAFLQRYETVRATDPVFRAAVSTHRCATSAAIPEHVWRQEPFYEVLASAGIFHAVQIPLVHRGDFLGTLNLGRPEPWPFDGIELRRLVILARHVAVAMGRARRFEQVESRRMLVECALDFLTLPLVVTALDGSLLFSNRSADVLLDRWTDGPYTPAVREAFARNADLLLAGRRVVTAFLPSRSDTDSCGPRAAARVRGASALSVRSTLVRGDVQAVVSFAYELPTPAPVAVPVLSPREQDIVDLVVRGLSNPEIAAVASITPNTVKQHLKRVFRKLGVSSRAELAAAVSRASDDLLTPPS
jgi:DNA-binding CsgD family transcriptional regulator/GAF domain-containing protein